MKPNINNKLTNLEQRIAQLEKEVIELKKKLFSPSFLFGKDTGFYKLRKKKCFKDSEDNTIYIKK